MSNFKKISKNIQLLTIANPRTNLAVDWLNINNAGKAEIEYLRKNYNFKLPHLRAASAKANSQRPMVIQENDYMFLILHFPVLASSQTNGVTSVEIEFFLGHGWLITLPSAPLEPLDNFFNLCKKDGVSLLSYELESSAILLYEILNKLLEYSFKILDANSIAIARAEQTVSGNDSKKSANQIIALRHNLINLRKIMQNHKNILKRLMSMESTVIPAEHIRKYYGQLIDQTKNIWETLENQREMVEVLFNSYQSQADYQLGKTMKTLTIFYVVFSSLSLVAAIFSIKAEDGMPFVNYRNGFWIILAIMGIIGLFMLLLFKRKRWL